MLVSLLLQDTEEQEIINYVWLGYKADGNVKNIVSLKDQIYILYLALDSVSFLEWCMRSEGTDIKTVSLFKHGASC
jgi:hypothetical protein